MDSDKKRLFILLGVLSVVLLYYLWSIGLFSPDNTEDQSTPFIQPSTAPFTKNNIDTESTGVEDFSVIVKEFRYDGTWVRDPFYYHDSDSLRAARGAYGFSNLRLTGISLQKGSDFTLINSMMFDETDTLTTANILKEGDRLGDFTIVKIAFDYVVLKQGDQKMRLTLYEK